VEISETLIKIQPRLKDFQSGSEACSPSKPDNPVNKKKQKMKAKTNRTVRFRSKGASPIAVAVPMKILPRSAGFHLAIIMAAGLAMASARGANIAVTNTGDNLAGSLRQAIQSDSAPGDTIVFQIPKTDPGYDSTTNTFTINLTSAGLTIDKSLTIDGGAQKIVVTRSTAGATPHFGIFSVTAGTVTLAHLTISNGYDIESAAGLDNYGGGITNAATLTVLGCALLNNFGDTGAGGIHNTATGSLQVTNCTFAGNTTADTGRAIENHGVLLLTSSTVSGNGTTGNNTAGVANFATAHVGNTIIADNPPDGGYTDVRGAFISDGYNFIGDPLGASGSASSGFGNAGSRDQVGTHSSPANPSLGLLENNGGPTSTMRPLVGSPVIDQGNGNGLTSDQRGQPRPVDQPGIVNASGGDGSDIGAVEVGLTQTGTTFTVTNTETYDDGQCSVDDCTLAEAVTASNANPDASTIVFGPGVSGKINGTGNLGISAPLTIKGPGARVLTVSGASSNRIFAVSVANVFISGLTLANGAALNSDGGAIYNNGGLTISDCAFFNNFASNGNQNGGGAIFNASGATLTLTRCTFFQNTTGQFGGALYNDGTLSATNCTFVANGALRGGAIISRYNNGASSSTLRNCTIANNYANSTDGGIGDGGGGYYAEGGAQQHHIANTIIALNLNSVNPDIRGSFTSDGHNLIGQPGSSSAGFTNGVNGDLVGTNAAGLNPQFGAYGNNGGDTDTATLLASSMAINAGNDALAPVRDQRNYLRSGVSDIGAFEFGGAVPVTLGNISTRAFVQTGDNVMIGGFIITGTGAKKVIIRAIGPSLSNFGITDALQNPTLELHDGTGALIATNDNWGDAANKQAIIDSQLAPSNSSESAILTTLNPGAYTAIVRGVSNGTGVALVEGYDLDRMAGSRFVNISTRALALTGDNVMIGGFVVAGPDSENVIVRAIGPSLSNFGITDAMSDPTLELHDGNGVTLASNDNWKDTQQAQIQATGYAPSNDTESAIVQTLAPGGYTAIVRGKNNTTGVALVEIYGLN
jgi:hypothetical protein